MKYAIASRENSLEAEIDQRFGRCAYIVTFETDTKTLEFFPNPFMNEDEGAGEALAKLLDKKGVKKVISGSFGIRIKELMDSRQMQMIIPHDCDQTVAFFVDLIEKR
jgi:predicted Fe-Mo cluster-binding NifX family protein